jgi:hypothetical protein
MKIKIDFTKPICPILLLLSGYFLIAVYLGVFLKHSFLISDVLGYWRDSLEWKTPFNIYHTPLYPLIIAFIRGVTFNRIPPVGLMMGINLAAYLISLWLIYKILQKADASKELSAIGPILFGLWPFVGIVYAVAPLADLPSMVLFLIGFYQLMNSRRFSSALLFGLAMITHKSMWVYVGSVIISDFFYRREYISFRNVLIVLIALLPIGILWITGSFYHGSFTWLFLSDYRVEFAPRGTLPILDGILGTFVDGGIKGIVKGSILLGLLFVSIVSLVLSARYKYQYFEYGIAISITSLIIFFTLNQEIIWGAVRFGRLVAIPLILIVNSRNELKRIVWWKSPPVIALFLILFISQVVFAWYMAQIYFG